VKTLKEILPAKKETAPETLEKKALAALRNKRLTLEALADKLNCAPKMAREVVGRLRDKHFNVLLKHGEVEVSAEVEAGGRLVVDSKDFFDGKWHRFGLLGDTHLGNRHARLDVLRALYTIYQREGIREVFHTGNGMDGECRFNKHELVCRAGIDAQLEYFANEYPAIKGMRTRMLIGDDHEGWWAQREGINVPLYIKAALLEKGRADIEVLGYIEQDIIFKAKRGQAWAKLMHPGGGTAYATSYAPQKIVESFQGGEKPHMLFIGHFHKFNRDYPREVHVVQTGCVEDQTPFMRKLKLQAHVGGLIIKFHQAETGEINRFADEWIPFYDKGFYAGKGKYRRW
jgi:hypothetical protein